MNKKIIIWCGDAPNQKALACRIAAEIPIAGIVVESRKSASKRNSVPRIISKIIDRLRFNAIYKSWTGLQEHYRRSYPDWPATRILNVTNINSEEVEKFTRETDPDLVVVSGTALIKKPLLDIPLSIGIINLHTGLSPYVKGGPNCTNWCIANNEWQYVGNTIMWINAGIDAGNIITTDTIDIRQATTLTEAQIMVMEHAHGLYLKAIQYLVNTLPPYISIPQSDFSGSRLFYTKMWTAAKRQSLLNNWRKRRSATLPSIPRTIKLPG